MRVVCYAECRHLLTTQQNFSLGPKVMPNRREGYTVRGLLAVASTGGGQRSRAYPGLGDPLQGPPRLIFFARN